MKKGKKPFMGSGILTGLLLVGILSCMPVQAYGSETAAAGTPVMDKVADSSDMAKPVELDLEGLTPVAADELQDGTYAVTLDCSSSMFKITDCALTVAEGEMEAVLTMSGTAYLYLYMGTGEEAAAADPSELISYEENEEGAYTFTVPVETLDAPVSCAAYSKNKEMWYDRTLVFRASSLPDTAFKESRFVTAESLALQDGTYTAEVSLEGGSGRASVTSPCTLRVKDGSVTAVIEWGSDKYDYMKVEDVRYDPVNTEGNSVFEIPVNGFDYPMPVLADTTAMSVPYEIEYTLYFDSNTLK